RPLPPPLVLAVLAGLGQAVTPFPAPGRPACRGPFHVCPRSAAPASRGGSPALSPVHPGIAQSGGEAVKVGPAPRPPPPPGAGRRRRDGLHGRGAAPGGCRPPGRPVAPLGTLSERPAMGNGPRGLQPERRRVELLHPRPGALPRLPLGGGRDRGRQRRPAAPV